MLEERFSSKFVVAPDGCWVWTAAKDRRGYGVYQRPRAEVRERGVARRVAAHRYAYEQMIGPIPAGLVLDHLCRNPSCVNPEHLEPVTHAENIRRGAGLGWALWDGSLPANHISRQILARTHCPQGHPYSGENLYFDKGARRCRTCSRERARKPPKRDPDRCRNGHDREHTYVDGSGRKVCRICAAEAAQRYRQRKRTQLNARPT